MKLFGTNGIITKLFSPKSFFNLLQGEIMSIHALKTGHRGAFENSVVYIHEVLVIGILLMYYNNNHF